MKRVKFRSRDSFLKWYFSFITSEDEINSLQDLVELGKVFEEFVLKNKYDIEVLSEYISFCDAILPDDEKREKYLNLFYAVINECKKIADPDNDTIFHQTYPKPNP
jgi:hypothetical protein